MKSIFKISVAYALFLFGLVMVAIYYGWFGEPEGTGGNFCEAARDGLIKQPANAFSNIGFIIAGLVAAYQLSKERFKAHNSITTSLFIAVFFVFLIISLGPGSMAMHATETHIGGYFDMLSMYLIASFSFAYAIGRLFNLKPVYFFLAFAVSLAVCHYFHYELRQYHFPIVLFSGSFIFAVLIVASFILEEINNRKNKATKEVKYGWLAAGTLLTAFGVWQFGFDGHPLCNPESLLQWHALWHILDALAVYFVFRYYVSEDDERFVSCGNEVRWLLSVFIIKNRFG